jgi:hypothetical protein
MGIQWEQMESTGQLGGMEVYRARVTGQKGELGWIVLIKAPNGSTSTTFVPDEKAIWDGYPASAHVRQGKPIAGGTRIAGPQAPNK